MSRRPAPARRDAAALDAADPLREHRGDFVIADPDVIYLDGNSLGRLPASTPARLAAVVEQQWGRGLVESWAEWIGVAAATGDLLAEHFLGAAPGQVVVCDSTSVNLYKAATAALAARPDRRVVVTDDANFPSDLYVLQGVCRREGADLRVVPVDHLADALDPRVALLSASHVAYRSGELLDVGVLTARAHEVGALTLWDLSHSVGPVPIALGRWGVDLAVGCTYKYLNGGPGAPAFVYVARHLQRELSQPIWGWFGQRDQFAMRAAYEPGDGIASWQVGTPPLLSLVAADEGIRVTARAPVAAVREKSIAQTGLLIELADAWLSDHGVSVATPRDPLRRGSHVALRHPQAWQVCQALIEHADVVPDFREPDVVRLGVAPLYTTYVELWDAVDRLRNLLRDGVHETMPVERRRVT